MLFSVAENLDASQPLVCTLPGEDKLSLGIQLGCCGNPCCDCRLLTLDLFEDGLLEEKNRHRLRLDLEKHCESKAADSTNSELCHRFYESLETTDWAFLKHCFLQRKTELTLTAEADELEPSFPILDA